MQRRKALPTPPKKSRVSAFLSDLRDLKPGDRVVHMDHGIGEFLGLDLEADITETPVASMA